MPNPVVREVQRPPEHTPHRSAGDEVTAVVGIDVAAAGFGQQGQCEPVENGLGVDLLQGAPRRDGGEGQLIVNVPPITTVRWRGYRSRGYFPSLATTASEMASTIA
jgi:hypothetical protein